MRIALHHTGEVGFRAGRILLADRRVEAIGLVDKSPDDRHKGRLERVRDWSTYDLLVTDDTEPGLIIDRAGEFGLSAVVWVELDRVPDAVWSSNLVMLSGSNLATGIAPCLASHEVARATRVDEVSVAWTEPGTPLRSGEPLAFPDPVGGRWGRRHDTNRYVAPVHGDWAGAMAKVKDSGGDPPVTRIVGVADLAPHLEALALAAGALAVGAGSYPPGTRSPADAAEAYLTEALEAGLDVAAYAIPAA